MKFGTRYGRLVTTTAPYRDARGKVVVDARCDCGQNTTVIVGNLKHRQTRSCGCLRRDVLNDQKRQRALMLARGGTG